jgi:hypothetical protein
VIAASYLKVLRIIYDRLNDGNVNWLLTASLGLALRGLPVEVHDIDLETDKRGAYEIERRLAEFVTKKVAFSEADAIRSHFGALTIDGIQVEIMGDLQIRRANGTWEGSDLQSIKRVIEVEGMQVPVPSLESEYEAYSRLGRLDKAKILGQWLHKE